MSYSKKFNALFIDETEEVDENGKKKEPEVRELQVMVKISLPSNLSKEECEKFAPCLLPYCNKIRDVLINSKIRGEEQHNKRKIVINGNHKFWALPDELFMKKKDEIKSWRIASRRCNEELILKTYDELPWVKEVVAIRFLSNPELLKRLFYDVEQKSILLKRFKKPEYFNLLRYLTYVDIRDRMDESRRVLEGIDRILDNLPNDMELSSSPFHPSWLYKKYGM